MITISACMIVKNEEAVLARCLDSLQGLVDELVVVDTGSTDRTKEIAAKYTSHIYDFEWIHDFAAARNYSFSKATMEYIYVVDADEVIDEENRQKFLKLKEALLPEIEVVQMYYANQLEHGTTYNFDKEYRGKLYKRLRQFHWVDQIHETVELEPVVYDSDIDIQHMPLTSHAGRDFHTFVTLIKKGASLSNKLIHMYARELFIIGEEEDFRNAAGFFMGILEDDTRGLAEKRDAGCVIAKCSRLEEDLHNLMKVGIKGVVDTEPASEICYELGEYFFDHQDYKEAIVWYYNAAYESTCALNIHYGGDYPLKRLAECFGRLCDREQQKAYEELAAQWSL